MNSLQMRLLSAAIGIPLFLGLAYWGEASFSVAVVVLSALAMVEMLRAYRSAGIGVNPAAAVMGVAVPAVCAIDLFQASGQGAGTRIVVDPRLLVGGILCAMTWTVVCNAKSGRGGAGRDLAYGLMVGAYISLFTGLSCLRSFNFKEFPGLSAGPVPPDLSALMITLLCVWTTDSFAFFAGRALGKRKLAPTISPGKTIEGAIGGLIGGVAVGAILGKLFFHDVALGLTIGLIAGLFGQIGDLFESALKRELEIKDFGGIMPGHGGVLDRFDSLLFVAPLTCLVLAHWPTR